MVDVSSPRLNLRAALAKLARLTPPPEHRMHWFDGGPSAYALPAGWRSLWVVVDGAVKRGPDAAEAYDTSLEGGVETVTFAAAPSSGVSVGIFAERKVQA